MQYGWIVDKNGNHYFAKEDGSLYEGFVFNNQNYDGEYKDYFYEPTLAKSSLETLRYFYYLTPKSIPGMIEGEYGKYYFDEKGEGITGIIKNGEDEFLYIKGILQKNGLYEFEGDLYYVGNGSFYERGEIRKNIIITDIAISPYEKGKDYYFDEKGKGHESVGWITLEGQKYYLENGYIARGKTEIDNELYYFKPGTYNLQYGFIDEGAGYWYYADLESGVLKRNGYVTVDGVLYKATVDGLLYKVTNPYDKKLNELFEKGNGTERDPYIVTTPEQLLVVSDAWSYISKGLSGESDVDFLHFKLGKDVDLRDTKWNIRELRKTGLDGDGYTISNLLISNDDINIGNGYRLDSIGMFSKLSESAYLKNIKLEKCKIILDSDAYMLNVGSLVGEVLNGVGQISNIYVSGNINLLGQAKYNAGGVIGSVHGQFVSENNQVINNSSNTKFDHIYSHMEISGNNISGNIGGIIGNIYSGSISDSGNYGMLKLEGRTEGLLQIGGIAGSICWGDVNRCFNCADIRVSYPRFSNVIIGGVVGLGMEESSISNSINLSKEITGNSNGKYINSLGSIHSILGKRFKVMNLKQDDAKTNVLKEIQLYNNKTWNKAKINDLFIQNEIGPDLSNGEIVSGKMILNLLKAQENPNTFYVTPNIDFDMSEYEKPSEKPTDQNKPMTPVDEVNKPVVTPSVKDDSSFKGETVNLANRKVVKVDSVSTTRSPETGFAMKKSNSLFAGLMTVVGLGWIVSKKRKEKR